MFCAVRERSHKKKLFIDDILSAFKCVGVRWQHTALEESCVQGREYGHESAEKNWGQVDIVPQGDGGRLSAEFRLLKKKTPKIRVPADEWQNKNFYLSRFYKPEDKGYSVEKMSL